MANVPNYTQVLQITTGQQVQLSSALLYSNDQLQPTAVVPLIWTCSDHTIAEFQSVNYENTQITVRAVAAGSCTVSVTDGTFTQTIALTVVAAPVVTEEGLIIEAGDAAPLQTQPTTQPTD